MSNKVKTTQRGATRNQSTADFTRENPFLFGNRYSEAVFLNNTGAELKAMAGLLVLRDVATAGQIKPAIAGDTLADVIGILACEGENTMADAGTLNVNYCLKGDIDASLLIFPDGVTLDTVVGNKTVKDILTDLGFVLFNVTENSKFDN